MTYSASRDVIGKKPLVVVGLVLDKCQLTYGVAPCTASVGVTGTEKCHNTRATCQDTANYTRGTTEYKFCQPRANLPIGENLIPAVSGDIQRSPTSVTSGKGLGKRSVVKVKIKDFTHHDRGIDPYVTERTYDPETTGTFWPRFLRRNPYFEGRTLKIYTGYINNPFSWDDFQVEEYDITDISGPDNGQVDITAKDILIRTYEEKAQYPAISNGKLLADIVAGAATATLTPSGIGDAEYPASGTVAIGKEAKTFTRSGDVLTFTAHGQWGTENKEHKAGDVVQVCAVWESVNVVDVLDELLTTGAGLPSAYIPYDNGFTGIPDNWDTEKDLWMSASTVYGILLKPESINKVIEELSEQFMFDIWWDAVAQEVRIKALSPERPGVTIPTLTEGYNILQDSVNIKRDAKDRVTEIHVWYQKIDYSQKDEIEEYSKAAIKVDPSRASADKYGSSSKKVILCRWINDAAQAVQLAGRLFARFADTPESINFDVAIKDEDSINIAERLDINSWQFQSFSGANETRRFQVTEIKEIEQGHSLRVSALTSYFSGRYWFIAPDSTPDYSSATEDQKERYGFICYDTGFFLDGEEAYKII